MTLENQVASIKPSIRLKELGVKQESAFFWIASRDKNNIDGKWIPKNFKLKQGSEHDLTAFAERNKLGRYISAFTVAELGEIISQYHFQGYIFRASSFRRNKWACYYEAEKMADDDFPFPVPRADTEADARAKMLIYLLENNLMAV